MGAYAKHLIEVAELAGKLASAFDAQAEAEFAGLLHDFGKYGDRFQQRLRGLASGVDHWTPGAWECLHRGRLQGVAAALCVQGHHIGLRQATRAALRTLEPKAWKMDSNGLTVSDTNAVLLNKRFEADGHIATPPGKSLLDWDRREAEPAAQMLNVRMLFSALTDADYLATERHFEGDDAYAARLSAPVLSPEACLHSVAKYLRNIEEGSRAPQYIKEMRRGLNIDCQRSARAPRGVFTLTAPTGTGKTLAMLAFALQHALEHNLRRVVVVIPYLTILEQTVQEYRLALADAYPAAQLEWVVLEDHSLAGTREPREVNAPGTDEAERRRKILAENWSAPFVVTTSVQFFESIFANRPKACRKLHHLANSVVLLDEVQSIPERLAIPTLATISALSSRFGTSVVLATATQPAFGHLEPEVKTYALAGWGPKEVVSDVASLFRSAVRTRVDWPLRDEVLTWPEVARLVGEQRQALCIVNLKRHAVKLYEAIEGRFPEGVFHLSTSMCPAHRIDTLNTVRRRLEGKTEQCLLISTQCVEAGVDLDFPAVFRAMGPLEGIAQAAGRCNRHGASKEGIVRVFRPAPDGRKMYPPSYGQASDVTEGLLNERRGAGLNIHDPDTFLQYYQRLYNLNPPAAAALDSAIRTLDFEAAGKEYRLIEKAALNVVVPYIPRVFTDLAREIRNGRLTADWIKRARRYSVGLFRPATDAPLWSWLEPVKLTDKDEADDWFLLADEQLYHPVLGVRAPDGLAWQEA